MTIELTEMIEAFERQVIRSLIIPPAYLTPPVDFDTGQINRVSARQMVDHVELKTRHIRDYLTGVVQAIVYQRANECMTRDVIASTATMAKIMSLDKFPVRAWILFWWSVAARCKYDQRPNAIRRAYERHGRLGTRRTWKTCCHMVSRYCGVTIVQARAMVPRR